MAIPLIVLAIGSIVAGYVGVPHAIGGNNRIERFLEPSFEVSDAGQKLEAGAAQAAEGRGQVRPVAVQETQPTHTEAAGGDESTELKLMAALERRRGCRHPHRRLLLAPESCGS